MATYKFKSMIWKYKGPASWYFVTLPVELSRKIRKKHGGSEEGWGRLKAVAGIGDSNWDTAIWFDTKFDSYLLPIKSSVRKKEKIQRDDTLSVVLKIRSDKKIIFS